MHAIARSPADCACFRISPDDTNYFVLLAEPADGVDFVTVVEIFERGGRTPPNAHRRAWEQFFVLRGEGIAYCAGREAPIRSGDVLLVPPGAEHVVANTGAGKLYCLTTMMPDEDFSALIRRGTPVALDAEDLAVLAGR